MVRSPQLAKFLSYIVHRTLDGEEQGIKAYSIAVDVFGRPPDFDPQSDPIVRVQARRLRALLNGYYEGEGAKEPVQIRLPTGRYIPEFVQTPPETPVAPPPAPPPRRAAPWWVIAVPLVLAICLGALGFVRWLEADPPEDATRGRPSITIVEFAKLATIGTPRISGLAIELVTDLEQFENLDVRYGIAEELDEAPQSDFVLNGAVQTEGDAVHYTASLTDTASRSTVWGKTISVRQAEAAQAGILDQISRSFSLVLGSPRGPLHAIARSRALAESEITGTPSIYACRVLFELYREDHMEPERVQECLARLRDADRSQAVPLAMGASLAMEAIPPDSDENDRAPIVQQALKDIEKALKIRPASSFVWEQRARWQEYRGDIAMARSNYSSAVQLNPANTSAVAALARLLVFTGWVKEARPLAVEALTAAPEPPAWHYGASAAIALIDGEFAEAVSLAERYAAADREIGLVLAVVAAQRAGNSEVVTRFLPPLLETASFKQKGILPRLRLRITDPMLLDLIAEGLLAAGVPPADLEQPF